ncbi:MAG TPA: PXPV repeat protein [Nevskia sp.]|nr:PXPV repeat protein [Nevskia sp.]
MKRTVLSLIAGAGLLALVPTAALAHTDVSIGLNLGGYAPAPVYAEPAPVYYAPPAPVYYGPVYRDDWRWREHREWEHRRWEEHRWHEEHDGWRR